MIAGCTYFEKGILRGQMSKMCYTDGCLMLFVRRERGPFSAKSHGPESSLSDNFRIRMNSGSSRDEHTLSKTIKYTFCSELFSQLGSVCEKFRLLSHFSPKKSFTQVLSSDKQHTCHNALVLIGCYVYCTWYVICWFSGTGFLSLVKCHFIWSNG